MKVSKRLYYELTNKQPTKKYGNQKVFYDGHWFDSKRERNYYIKLKMLEDNGDIEDLQLQVKYELQPSFKINGKTIRKIEYVADFTYKQDGMLHIIDTKGFRTEVYKLKKKLFEYKYGLEIEEV